MPGSRVSNRPGWLSSNHQSNQVVGWKDIAVMP